MVAYATSARERNSQRQRDCYPRHVTAFSIGSRTIATLCEYSVKLSLPLDHIHAVGSASSGHRRPGYHLALRNERFRNQLQASAYRRT